ncbi:hypothetical protein Bca4012_003905 [Brassica carinata]
MSELFFSLPYALSPLRPWRFEELWYVREVRLLELPVGIFALQGQKERVVRTSFLLSFICLSLICQFILSIHASKPTQNISYIRVYCVPIVLITIYEEKGGSVVEFHSSRSYSVDLYFSRIWFHLLFS